MSSALPMEWTLWALTNGVPGIVATLGFLLYPPFDRFFAWDVEDRRTGIFLGTGFLLRIGIFVNVLTAKSFNDVRWQIYGNAVFVFLLLAVTLIWGDLFRWRRAIAIIWLFLYIEEPIWMLTLVPQAQAAVGIPIGVGAPVLLWTKIVLVIEAVIMLVGGIYLWVIPRLNNPRWWPWKPDLVSARIMASFLFGWVAWAITLALAPSWSEARFGIVVDILWFAGILLSLIVFRRQFDLSNRTTRLYGGVTAFLLLALGSTLLIQGV
jgi:hypothetical protein